MNRPTIAAPEWHQLPETVRIDFDRSQFGGWYQAADNDRRLTLVNNYMKMKPAGLWDFVKEPACEPHETEAGRLVFIANDLQSFHNNLTQRPDFSDPELSVGWRSREHVGDNSLHFKNFENWPLDKVQAHIDPYGITPSQDLQDIGKGMPPPPGFEHSFDQQLIQLGRHAAGYAANADQNVHHINERLQGQGFGLDIPFGQCRSKP